MNKKTRIQIIIIVCMFLASGIVLYVGFGGSHSSGPAVSTPDMLNLGVAGGIPSGGNIPDQLLPYGDQLDFSAIKDSRFNYNTNVISVNAPQEVGLSPDQLIKSTSTAP